MNQVARRILGAVPLLLGIATVLFAILALVPGDPAIAMAGPNTSQEVVDQIRRNLGLDRSLPERYVRWLFALARGDLGISISEGRPVADVISDRIGPTLLLTGTSLFLASVLGVVVGVVQATRQNSLMDGALSIVSLFFYSMPSFWLALMLMLIFAVLPQTAWDWPVHFPVSGMASIGLVDQGLLARTRDVAWHMALPALTLALVLAGGVARFARSSLLEVIRQDYIRTARAKGLSERAVVWRHAFRNGLIPLITLLGLYLPVLFSGAVFVESVFAWPGMGRLIVDAIDSRDYPVVMASSMLFAVLVVVGNLVADLLYRWADPRIRLDGSGRS